MLGSAAKHTGGGGGYDQEWRNTTLLFVNLKPPGSSQARSARKYANVFRRLSLDADSSHLTMTWFGSPGQTRTSAPIARLLARAEAAAAADTEAVAEAGKVVQEGGVLLYARHPGGSYVLLSRVRPHTVSDADDDGAAVTITWLLMDTEQLLHRMPKMANLICEEEEVVEEVVGCRASEAPQMEDV